MTELPPEFKQSGWIKQANHDVMINHLSCACKCPNQLATGRHFITITISKKEEMMCTSNEGLQKLIKEKYNEGVKKLAEYKCEE